MNTSKAPDALYLALLLGLLTGLAEAAAGLLSSAAGRPVRVNAEILWIAPLVNGVLFAAVGAGLALAGRLPVFGRHPGILLVLLPWMGAFVLLQLTGFISIWAQVMLSLGLAVTVTRLGVWVRLPQVARRGLAPLLALALIAACGGAAWASWSERRTHRTLTAAVPGAPNVLLITLDTVRADHLSAYGYHRPTTPHLDGLARGGVLFEHALANSSWTLPSHASLLTGRHPHEHGADWRRPMDDGRPTLAEVLAARGYVTAAFAANTSYVAPEWGLGRGFARFDVYGASGADDVVRTVVGRRIALNVLPRLGYFDIPGRKRATQLNDAFASWLNERGDRPFFALLNYFDAHDPYLTVDPYQTRYSADPARGDVINFQFQPHAFRRQPLVTPDDIRAEIDAYDGCVTYLDAQLGRLFEELSRQNLTENTLVVITSDHGESFGNHDLFGHGNSLYLETLRVPLLVSWPGRVPAGVRVAQPVGLERIPATIVDLLGGQAGPAPFPGSSLANFWRTAEGGAEPHAEPVLAALTGVAGGPEGYPSTRGSLTSLVTDKWHLILSSTQAVELYAWPHDPDEQHNLAGRPETQAVEADLLHEIQRLTSGNAPARR